MNRPSPPPIEPSPDPELIRNHPAGSLATARQPFPADQPEVPDDASSIDALKATIVSRSGAPKPIPPLLPINFRRTGETRRQRGI